MAIIGEASGEHEQRDQLPFRPWAPAGGVLERTLRRLGHSREDFVISNVIRCRPFNNELAGAGYESAALERCKENLIAFLRRYQPKVIIALGNTALRALTGMSGSKRTVSHLRGYVLRALPEFCEAAGIRDLLVVPTYHPSFLRRGAMHLAGVFARDIQRAVNIRQGRDRSFILDLPSVGGSVDTIAPWEKGYVAHDAPETMAEIEQWLARYNLRYNLRPTRADLDLFCRDVKARSDAWLALSPAEQMVSPLALSHDIETEQSLSLDEDESDAFSDTKITLSQFSIEPGQAIVLDWTPEHIQATRWLLKLPLPKVGQNYWMFDWRVLRAVGKRDFNDITWLEPAGTVFDTMQQFHYFQPDLPAHLQYAASYAGFPFPWKHLAGANIEFYGACDPDAALRVHHVTMRTMIDRGIWFDAENPERAAAGYLGMVQAVRPILARMEERGLPINDERRLALGVQFDAVHDELFTELDARYPDSARKLTPKQKGVVTGYADIPADVKQMLERLQPTPVPVFTETEQVTPASTKRKKDGSTEEIAERRRTIILDAAGQPVTKKFRDEQVRAALRTRWDNVTETEMQAIRACRFQEPPDADDYEGDVPPIKQLNAAGHMVYVDAAGEEVPSATYFYDQRLVGQQTLDEGRRTPGNLAWVRVYEFSPNSSHQLMAYMKARGHEIPYDKKKKSETTSKRELDRLSAKTKDDFYTKVIECREMSKMSSVYIDGFKPAADGRVHTTFTFATATGQLSSRAPNCFSTDTEVLTDRGWVMFPELLETDLVAEWQWNSAERCADVRFSKPLAYIRNEHAGTLVHVRTEQQIDLLMTNDHGCLLLNKHTLQIERIAAVQYPDGGYKQLQAGRFIGGGVDLTAAQVAMICAVQADGYVSPPKVDRRTRKRGMGGHITLTFRKQRKIDRLAWALAETGIEHKRSLRKNGQTNFYISRKNIPAWLAGKKRLGAWVLTWSRAALDCMAEEIWLWDGSADLRSMYSSSIKENTDWAQIITLLTGRRAKVRLYPRLGTRNDNWQVDASHRDCSLTDNSSVAQVPYIGTVHCVTMPWGSVIVRRNGKAAFTGQCQNYPAHGKLGKAVKSMIEAPAGYEQSNWDFKSYHVLMLGFLAEDPTYMRMARLDMHSFVTWHFLKLPGADTLEQLPDAELLEKFAWLKSDETRLRVRNKQAKCSILGIGLGLMPPNLYELNRDHFESLKHVQRFRDQIQALFPKVFRWQEAVCQEAHEQQVLRNRFAMLRWFYEVKAPDGRGGWKPGDQWNAAMAFRVQSDAHGDLRERLKAMRRTGIDEKYGLYNTIHDSFQFCYPKELRAEMYREVGGVLSLPSNVLTHPVLAPGGLEIGVECAVGPNMAEMKLYEGGE